MKHIAPEDIPATEDLHSSDSLEDHVQTVHVAPFSLIVVGDIMLGGRARRPIAESGARYPFEAVLPLLRRAPIVLGNLEGPLARESAKQDRNFSYRVHPTLASSLAGAGVNVVTLANNHLLDCGRGGVLETLDALKNAGVAAIGAGVNREAAHQPCILQAGTRRVGLLGYYWNRRTAATVRLPGSARDAPEAVRADIVALRGQADRVVVTCHWGIPYEREPSPADRQKARFAIDCGADAVVGHHPHIIQPFEVYRGRPIFYSVGNFAFGSGNSRAESLLLGIRFEERRTRVCVYPLYVKNRDPRVNYQPKVLRGEGAQRVLGRLETMSSPQGHFLAGGMDRGELDLPWPAMPGERRTAADA